MYQPVQRLFIFDDRTARKSLRRPSHCMLRDAGNGTAVIVGVGGGEPPSDLPMGTPWVQYDTNSDGLPNLYPWSEQKKFAIIVNPTTDTTHINPGDSDNAAQKLTVKMP